MATFPLPQPSRQYIFTAGTVAVAAQVNTELNTVYAILQGAIGDAHIADQANIAGTKIASGTITGTQLATNTIESNNLDLTAIFQGEAAQTGGNFNLSGTLTQIPGLSQAITTPLGSVRKVRLDIKFSLQNNTSPSVVQVSYFKDAGGEIDEFFYIPSASVNFTFCSFVIDIPNPGGGHTYTVSAKQVSGSGTSFVANSTLLVAYY